MNNLDTKFLIELGFTNLEALIYIFLLENSPATGYGIAKGIGKPAANTYKAIESLHSKGGIIIEDSTTRRCRAVTADELLDNLQHRFMSLKDSARSELKKYKPSPGDKRIYQLQSTEQVLSRYRKMIERASRVAIFDFFPFAVKQLKKEISAAAKRGVQITLKTYESCHIPGIEIIIDPQGKRLIERWPGLWANGVVDGEEYLLAFLTKDGADVIQAVWSNNYFLSWIYYGAIVEELKASALEQAINADKPSSELKKILKKYNKMMLLESTGYKDASKFFESVKN
ncbi:MAG: helix-turn-helix domain-containing protein [Candidatus Zixiibacteriota bacterium]